MAFGFIKNLFSRPAAAPEISSAAAQKLVADCFNAAYYASTENQSSMDFSWANNFPGINERLRVDLEELRRNVQYELSRNPVGRGIRRTYANLAVASSPKISVQSSDSAWSEKCEALWNRWIEHCDYRRGLSLGLMLNADVKGFFDYGEILWTKRIGEKASVLSLKYERLNPARLTDPMLSTDSINGVIIGDDGRPKGYYILPFDPGAQASGALFNQWLTPPVPVAASNIVHVFDEEEASQTRGEPWLAASVTTLNRIRLFDQATITAATLAAKLSMVVTQTYNPRGIANNAPRLPKSLQRLADGAVSMLAEGQDVKQISATQPAAAAQSFRRDLMAASGNAVGMPQSFATNDSSSMSFSGASWEGGTMFKEIEHVHALINNQLLDRVFADFIEIATATGELAAAPDDLRPMWRWKADARTTNPLQVANAVRRRMANGVTFAEECLSRGEDPEESTANLKKEIDAFHALKLPHWFLVENGGDPFEQKYRQPMAELAQ
jgi:capsid protein